MDFKNIWSPMLHGHCKKYKTLKKLFRFVHYLKKIRYWVFWNADYVFYYIISLFCYLTVGSQSKLINWEIMAVSCLELRVIIFPLYPIPIISISCSRVNVKEVSFHRSYSQLLSLFYLFFVFFIFLINKISNNSNRNRNIWHGRLQ